MNTKAVVGFIVLLIVVIGGAVFLTRGMSGPAAAPATSGVIQVVAAENFWGSLVSQIGGSHVQVLSIVSDPNADPHEYESNADDARAVANAAYVIENGAGYDSWMDNLLGAGGNQTRKVLQVADLLGKKEGNNPHFWYQPAYVNEVIAQMEQDLIAIDPAHTSDYQQNYQTLVASLASYQNKMADIKARYAGTPVGATEDIFVYFADATGLNLTTPPAFIQAVGEGNDPPAQSVVTFQNQIKAKQIKVLVYNVQTATPITESIKSLAQSEQIPIVGISETTQPPDAKFQDWMMGEVTELESALASSTGK